MTALQTTSEEINSNKYITLDPSIKLKLKDGEFIQFIIDKQPSLLVIAQKHTCEINGVYSSIALLVYRNDKDLYPIFYYAIAKLMYHSIMYFRHLPIKLFNRFSQKERFEHEKNNIKILLSILSSDYANFGLLDNIWINSDNIECKQLLTLSREFPADKWEITNTRMNLFDIINDRIEKIEKLYKNKKYKEIREIGYEIHNIPEMICKNKIFESNFTEFFL